MDTSKMLFLYNAVIWTVIGFGNPLYIPAISNFSQAMNTIELPKNVRQPKSSVIEEEKLSPDGIIENIHHVVQDFQVEKDDTDDEINYQGKNLPLNVNLEKTSLQHDQLIFGPSYLKVGLKPEENNYQVPKQSSVMLPSFPSPVRTRSIEEIPSHMSVSNEILNVTDLSGSGILESSDSNSNPIKMSMSNLEDHIRSEVHEEIQKEKTFESTIIDVLGDIPEPEVRETLKQDLLDSNYSEKQKEISEIGSSLGGEQIDFIAKDDQVMAEKEKKAKKLEETSDIFGNQSVQNLINNIVIHKDSIDKTNTEQLFEVENDPATTIQNKMMQEAIRNEEHHSDTILKKSSLKTESIYNQNIESIDNPSLKTEINSVIENSNEFFKITTESIIEINQEKTTEIQYEHESNENLGKTIALNGNVNMNKFQGNAEKEFENVNEIKVQERHFNEMKNNPEKDDFSTLQITENLISVGGEEENMPTEEENRNETYLKSVQSVEMKNDFVVDTSRSDAEHTHDTNLESYNSTSFIKNNKIDDEDMIVSHVKEESYGEGRFNARQSERNHQIDLDLSDVESEISNNNDNNNHNFVQSSNIIEEINSSDLKSLEKSDDVTKLELQLSIENQDLETTEKIFNENISSEDVNLKILQMSVGNDNESQHQVVPIKSNENLLAPLILPESGPQIKELLRSIHGGTIEDKNSSDIPIQFPDSSSEKVPVLSVFSISTFLPEIFPSVQQTNFNLKSNEDNNETQVMEKNLQEQSTDILSNLRDSVVEDVTTENNDFSLKDLSFKEDNLKQEQEIEIFNVDTITRPSENNANQVKSFTTTHKEEYSEAVEETTQKKNLDPNQSFTTNVYDIQQRFEYDEVQITEKPIEIHETTIHNYQVEYSEKENNYDGIENLPKVFHKKEDEIKSEVNEEQKKVKQIFEEIPIIIEYHDVENSVTTDTNDFDKKLKNKVDVIEMEISEISLPEMSETERSLKFEDNFDSTTEITEMKTKTNDVISTDVEDKLNENEIKNLISHSTTVEVSPIKNEINDDLHKSKIIGSLSQSDNVAEMNLKQEQSKSISSNSTKDLRLIESEKESATVENIETTKKYHLDSSSEELSDSSEEKDSLNKYKIKSSFNSEPLKLSLYNLLSEPVSNSDETAEIESKIESTEKDKIPQISYRFHQGRSLSFENVNNEQTLQDFQAHSQKSPTEVVFSDDVELPVNFDHTVIKRPGVDTSESSQSSHESQSSEESSTTFLEERSLNNENSEVQTAFMETLIEAAELTTDINRHILSFRSSSEAYNGISIETFDFTTIENGDFMVNNNMGKTHTAEIIDELVEKSNITILLAILIGLVGLITIIAISIVVFLKFKSHTATLDIQMEEQQRQKLQEQNHQQQHEENESKYSEIELKYPKEIGEEEEQQHLRQEKDMDIENENEQASLNDLGK